jgi:hypothetical protein
VCHAIPPAVGGPDLGMSVNSDVMPTLAALIRLIMTGYRILKRDS